eukprot:6183394-Pleurochrysis_carterae.AAC.3
MVAKQTTARRSQRSGAQAPSCTGARCCRRTRCCAWTAQCTCRSRPTLSALNASMRATCAERLQMAHCRALGPPSPGALQRSRLWCCSGEPFKAL